ncbi:MAG: transglycosylase SLT domain-containing protein, partial [Candidatus Binatia bacterium]
MRSRSQVAWCVVVLTGMIAAGFLLPNRVHADVYYYKDSVGILHFTSVPRPGALPFLVDPPPLARMRSDDAAARRIQDTADYDEIIGKSAKRFRVEPALIKAMIRAESGFNRLATSPAGARGLMQLMPQT